MTRDDKVDAYWCMSKQRYLVKVFGKHLRTRRGRERTFKTLSSAEKAAADYIKRFLPPLPENAP